MLSLKPIYILIFLLLIFFTGINFSQEKTFDNIYGKNEIEQIMFKATKFFVDNISYKGGYLWTYSIDLSRRWGELEAYPTMIWVQGAGTVEMGNLFLDTYESTKNEYYYEQAEKAAYALIQGQLECGGWNYLIDFGGEESIEEWYNTIGKNAWRLEEFHHYYGNATFDDGATSGAALYLLRFYLIKKNQVVKIALDKALDFILKSQYYEGSWPQRYPVQNEFYPNEKPDYTTYHTFNDGVISNNLFFLLSCYTTLQNEKLLEPILKTMDFFIESIFSKFQNGWALQYDLEIKPASARTYEPASLDPQLSYRNCEMLLKFYQITGDERFLNIVPGVIKWIESVKLGDLNTDVIIVPKFVEVGSNKPLYVHRRGENTFFGNYYIDYKSGNEIIHYPSIRYLNLQLLKNEYERTKSIKVNPLSGKIFIPGLSNDLSSSEKLKITRNFFFSSLFGKNDEDLVSKDIVQNIVSELDEEGRWLTNNVFISNPYIGIPEEGDLYTDKYSTTFVGNSFDTSPYPNQSADKYISTSLYIRNMKSLINYLKKINL